jgi:hypothetical protein
MDNLRRISGFAVAFLMLTAVSAAAVTPKSGGVRLLHQAEAAKIRGGCSTSGGGSAAVNIPLNNVPYVNQYINPYDNRNTSQEVSRSTKYCGIASALMVRAKYEKGASSAPFLHDISRGYNFWDADADMKKIDGYLLNGRYGSTIKRVDVLANQGLLYVDSSLSDNATNWSSQYNTTVGILEGVYTGKLGGIQSQADAVHLDNRHVTGVSMRPISASLKSGSKEISDATKAIWNHIKDYRQPVVVVVDSNKQVGNIVRMSSNIPTLHYIVIRGISEDSSGGTRYFYAYDPFIYINDLKYSESDLRKLIALPDNTLAWVYKYGNQKVGSDPAYILTVQGD